MREMKNGLKSNFSNFFIIYRYSDGMDHEIYRIKLSEKMEKKYFKDVVRIIYKKTKAIVFAI
jgi:hypothetical protein